MTLPATASPEVIVAGLGAVGSAALYQLARRGCRVLGLDRLQPPHDRGSSHGGTRITRLALGEGEAYVPLARRSHEVWRELEAATGRTLFRQVGGLIYAPGTRRGEAHGSVDFLQTTVEVARRHGIAFEWLEGPALAERFPQFRFRGDESGYFEPEAGLVHPEACVAAQIDEARRLGAQVRTGTGLDGWRKDGEGIVVETAGGPLRADGLILCAGAWMPGLVPALAPVCRVLRQVQGWFEPDGPHEWFESARMPVYIRVPDPGSEMFYGFPAIDGPHGGLKVATEQFEVTSAPDAVGPRVEPGEEAALHRIVAPHLRITGNCVRSVACKYTVTPDFAFVIDRHPESDRVWIASACSGHGFKHSAAVGESLAELATVGVSRIPLEAFRLDRFGKK